MSGPELVKSGELLKLKGSRLRLSKLSWKPKLVDLHSDGTITYRSVSKPSSDGTKLALIPCISSRLHPSDLVEALLALKPSNANAALVVVYVAEDPDKPPRELVFIARDNTDAVAWRDAAETAAGKLSSRPLCSPDVSASARALNYRVKADAVASARRYAGDDICSDAILRELRVPEACRLLIADGKTQLDVEELAELLRIEVKEAEKRVADADGDVIDAAVLRELLCAEENSVLAPDMVAMGDMNRPMNDYFVCSSHNTYLTGDQVMSSSAAVMYRAVLELGVRCLELDLWDGENGPMITHGNTATSNLALESALETIAEFSFIASQYPLILSLENHLSLPNQVIAAHMFKKTFGDMLQVVRLGVDDLLPSPEELKGKVLIKAKMGEWATSHSSPDSEDSFDEEDDGDEGNSPVSCKENENKTDIDEVSPRSFPNFLRRKSKSKGKKSSKQKHHLPIAKELADLTSFGGANRKKLLALWEEGKLHPDGQIASDIVSINENKVEGIYESSKADALTAYNSRNMTRVYPKASRIDSSNFNPMPAWGAGCQIVAMNYQSEDVGLWLNHGRFAVNQRCGYALKPGLSNCEISGAGVLTISVLCGSLIPRSPTSRRGGRDCADPYVELAVAGRGKTGKAVVNTKKTESVKTNGLCPSWGDTFRINVVDAETDMLLACVWDDDTASKDNLIGFFSAPISALREGLRALHLSTPDGVPLTVPGTCERPSVVARVEWSSAIASSAV